METYKEIKAIKELIREAKAYGYRVKSITIDWKEYKIGMSTILKPNITVEYFDVSD